MAQIESVLVESHDAAVDIIGSESEKWHPTRRETADHSLPYIVAVALADGEVAARQFEPARFAHPELLALVQKVEGQRNAELSACYPQAAGNIVTVRLRDGRTLSERVDFPRGHAQNPLSDAEVEAKFHALAGARLGPGRADALLRWLWRLDEARDWGGLISSMTLSN